MATDNLFLRISEMLNFYYNHKRGEMSPPTQLHQRDLQAWETTPQRCYLQ